MWTILIDNPFHDDLTIKLIHMTVNAIKQTLQVNKILLRTTHIPIEIFTFDVQLTNDIPDTDIVYLTGKTGLSELPLITQSCSDLTNDLVVKYRNDTHVKPILQTIGITDPAHRSYVREYGIYPEIKTVSKLYMFYPGLDLDTDVTIDTSIALNSQGYGYEKVSFLKSYVRYIDPNRGLFVRKSYNAIIPKILHVSDTTKEWDRVLTSDWSICQSEISDRWLTYQSYYDDSIIKQLITHLGYLEHTGGIIIPANTKPADLIPTEILSQPFVTFFDDNYDLDLSVFGSIAKAGENEFARLEILIANRVSPDDIINYLKQFIVYPPSYRKIFDTITIVEEPPVLQKHSPNIIVRPDAIAKQLTVNPRDLIMSNDY